MKTETFDSICPDIGSICSYKVVKLPPEKWMNYPGSGKELTKKYLGKVGECDWGSGHYGAMLTFPDGQRVNFPCDCLQKTPETRRKIAAWHRKQAEKIEKGY